MTKQHTNMRPAALRTSVLASVAAAALLCVHMPLAEAVVQGSGQYVAFYPCVTEDSEGPCYWDARTMGNGEGRSFTVWGDGSVWYW